MDRAIERGFWHKRKILTIVGITALVVLIAGSYYSTSGKSRLNADTERITVSECNMGVFQETVPVNGSVLPKVPIYLDALEGGVVEERYVEDGTMLTQGQPILKLSNTNLELRRFLPANRGQLDIQSQPRWQNGLQDRNPTGAL